MTGTRDLDKYLFHVLFFSLCYALLWWICLFQCSCFRNNEIHTQTQKKKIIHQTTVSINCLWIVNILDDGCQFNHCIYFHLSFNVITIVFRQRPNDATSIQKKLFCLLKFWYFFLNQSRITAFRLNRLHSRNSS